MKKLKKKLIKNKGLTGIDITISIIILALLTGVILTLFARVYINALEIRKSSNAMTYATIILEKIDEEPFEQIDNNFIEYIKPKINFSEYMENYNIQLNVSNIDERLLKRVDLTINYFVGNIPRTIKISKIKVKEICKYE